MKIAVYHELHKGGARRGTNEFAKQLIKRGHIVDLYTIDKLIKEEKEFYSSIYSFEFPRNIWKENNWRIRLHKDTLELISLWMLNKKIARIINEKKYDLAYITASQFIETPFILNYLSIPKFFYLNDPYYRMIYEPSLFNPQRSDILRKIYERINRFIRKRVDKFNAGKIDYVLAASNFTMEQFINVYGIKKGVTAYYGVDTKFFYPINTAKDIDILFIGSQDLLDGYPLFKNIIKNLKSKVKVRTVLYEKEWLNDIQLRDIYRRTKILVATSYNEPLGLVPLEAMACKAIVLAVNEAGYKETVSDGLNGFLIKRNAREFAKKIDFLLKNPEILNNMSKKAIITTNKEWAWSIQGEKLQKIILKALENLSYRY